MNAEAINIADEMAAKMAEHMTPNYQIALLFLAVVILGAGIIYFLHREYLRLAKKLNDHNERYIKHLEESQGTLTTVLERNTAAFESVKQTQHELRAVIEEMRHGGRRRHPAGG